MARTTYRQFKQAPASRGAARRFHTSDTAEKIVELTEAGRRRPQETRTSTETLDYSTFKETIASAIGEIKTEIQHQHEHTRVEVQAGALQVVNAVKASPAAYIKATCEFGGLFLTLSLILRFGLKIELVNPAFAVFGLAALAVYWTMAHVKQRTDDSKPHKP